ncbi:dihydrofolate reductase [candidate division KSB1 bacterium]|nr:dihydrofolate reductase [candidate division KSB1 bacterium]
MKKLLFVPLMFLVIACSKPEKEFVWQTEQFADLRIIRYQVPGFDELDLNTKKLLYYLTQAGLSGRDIIYDQNYKYNLAVRRTLESIVENYQGDRTTEAFKEFLIYTKRVWFSNGIHHHYSSAKMKPGFSEAYFKELVENSLEGNYPLEEGETLEQYVEKLTPIIFDPAIAAKRVNLDAGVDNVALSANNYYEGVTQAEVEAFYAGRRAPKDDQPVSHGLNSKLVKENGTMVEKVWHVGGMYSAAIERIVYWLEKASSVAQTDAQKRAFDLLIEYYKTGDLRKFDEFSIAWVADTASTVDVINGFIEVYGDAVGYRGAYESIVQLKDEVATKRIAAIAAKAQWFEDESSIMDEHKKANVKGITANVVNVVGESGDASPSTPIGVNLPNANWIRSTYGSKSVNLGNIVHGYNESSRGSGSLEEFAWSEEDIAIEKKWGALGDDLHTDMHEVIGHASGKLNPGIGTPKETLKSYASTLEEARADLVALYYLMDERLISMGILPTLDVGKSQYNSYILNGLMKQLRRLELGENLEEAHMRNRQLVAKWAYEMGKADNVIEMKKRDGKTYFVINDYLKLRDLFGQLLREIQRLKSEGDYEAGKNLVETYGVKVDPELHKEVLARYEKLNIAPYGGFINPKLVPVEKDGEIIDVTIEYPDDFTAQMLDYAKNYSFLPTYN